MFNVKDIKTGKQLKQLRKSLSLSQERFASMIGYTLNRISFIERNDKEVTEKLRRALKHSIK